MQTSYFDLEKKYNELFMKQQRINTLQQEIISEKDEVILALQEISAIKNQQNATQEMKETLVGGAIGGVAMKGTLVGGVAIGGSKGSGVGRVCGCTLTSKIAEIHQSKSEWDAVQATLLFLEGIMGKQETFFATVQATLVVKVAELLKRLYGDSLITSDFIKIISNKDLLKSKVNELKAQEGESELTSFFEDEKLLQTYFHPVLLGINSSLK